MRCKQHVLHCATYNNPISIRIWGAVYVETSRRVHSALRNRYMYFYRLRETASNTFRWEEELL